MLAKSASIIACTGKRAKHAMRSVVEGGASKRYDDDIDNSP